MAFPAHCLQRHLSPSILFRKMGRRQLLFSSYSCLKDHLRQGLGMGVHCAVYPRDEHLSLNAALSSTPACPPDSSLPLLHQADPEREAHCGANTWSLGNGALAVLWVG